MNASERFGSKETTMSNAATDKRLAVGVFSTVPQADRAIEALLAAGFSKNHLSVICSDAAKEKHFELEGVREHESGSETPSSAAAGAAIGALWGGLIAAGGLVTGSGVLVLAAGTLALGGGAAIGGFIGAMMTRGLHKEAADYYEQAVEEGRILVAVEDQSDDYANAIARAERVLADCGAEPVAVPAG
jgi:hypothetical protein